MLKQEIKNFPDSPGVYLMRDGSGKVIYVGKAASLKERVRSYFYQTSPKAKRITPRSPRGEVGQSNLPIKTVRQMEQVETIEFQQTETELEALLLESKLIKKYAPHFNIVQKDDKSRAYVYFSREKFPRISILRETDLPQIHDKNPVLYGPFLSAGAPAQALELIRKIAPFRTCRILPKRHCLYGRLGLCEMPCEEKVSEADYKNKIRQVRDFFEGKKSRVLSGLKKELKLASKKLAFERAAKIRDRLYALDHLRQVFAIRENMSDTTFRRIEGYDVSNISGAFATGSMVVFSNGESEKSGYRKFKIKSVVGPNDTSMLKEVLRRRFKHAIDYSSSDSPAGGESRKSAVSRLACSRLARTVKKVERGDSWSYPDLILIDGGRSQVGAAMEILKYYKLDIPVVGLAKGPDRKRDELITSRTLPRHDIKLFKQIRDEAHRFARGYYKKLHRKSINSD